MIAKEQDHHNGFILLVCLPLGIEHVVFPIYFKNREFPEKAGRRDVLMHSRSFRLVPLEKLL